MIYFISIKMQTFKCRNGVTEVLGMRSVKLSELSTHLPINRPSIRKPILLLSQPHEFGTRRIH